MNCVNLRIIFYLRNILYLLLPIEQQILGFIIKVWNMKNVSILYQQKPITRLSMFCLIQGINNYVQINTYWSYMYIVRIIIFINLASWSNILLLVSKKMFLTSHSRGEWVMVWIVEPLIEFIFKNNLYSPVLKITCLHCETSWTRCLEIEKNTWRRKQYSFNLIFK
jgi:hypothetical protein